MIKRIIKRDGTEVAFDINKIKNAISKANVEVEETDRLTDQNIEVVTTNVVSSLDLYNRAVEVEEIQELVETELMRAKAYEVAKHYIRYRYDHKLKRESDTDKKILSLVEYNNESVKQENSNKDPEIIPTQRDYIAGEISKDITMRKLLPESIAKAHEEGIIHFHDADYFIQHSHNCFTGGTKFVTDKGVREFKSFKDGELVVVKDMNGCFRTAMVHRYGKQSMQVVTLKNSKMQHRIICTQNHRWILNDGTVTTSLSVGDRLAPTKDSTGYDILTKEDAEAFCIGFVIGDGCDHKSSAIVRLCGAKTQYIDIFKKAGHSVKPIKNSSDINVYMRNAMKQDFLNGHGWRFMNVRQKELAFKGYYAADGAKNSNRITTSDERIENFIEEVSAIAGYYISSRREEIVDTNYKKNARRVTYHFITKTPENWLWRVIDICPYMHGEVDAWCVEEPITHTFTLDKGIVTGNCCLVNLEDMLQNGTVISGTLIEKPHTFSTACNIATQIIAQVASSQYGGQSISLAHLAPFVDDTRRKLKEKHWELASFMPENDFDIFIEKLVAEDITKGVQTIQYQVVTLMTTNGQAPFITVYMDINEAKNVRERRDLAAIIEETLKQRIQGVKNEVGVWNTPAFPKLIYALDENNVYPDSEYYYLTELAAKCTAKRMVPDYISNKVQRELKNGDTYVCMGCRSFLTPDRFTDAGIGNISKAKNYIPWQHRYYGRFNQGVVTINLPDVALSSQGDFKAFDDILKDRLENLCYPALMARHERLKGTLSNVAPILWQYGALARLDKDEPIDPLLYNGYSTISLGYAGLYECVKYMTGESHTGGGKDFALHVMNLLNEYTAKWKAETNIDFSLYGTPLESTTYKFAKCLQKRFGIIPGITEKNYITNSYHVHVTEPIDAFTKLSFESEFQALSPGGAISYIEVPNMNNNIPAVLSVIQYIYENIMYAELNTRSDYCQVCGFEGEIKTVEDGGKLVWECPVCGNRDQTKLNVARRTCGYIGTNFWNQGRTQEIAERVLHL